jgi:RNA polymerase sigma-70 factor (ECF subfamily)
MEMSCGRADWFPTEIGSPFVSEDEQVLRAAVAGDAQALTTFVRDTQQHVWRFCAYLGRGADVDDLVQETYARALRALPRFEGRSSVRAWLLAIARRVCADAVRGARRQRAIAALPMWRDRTEPDGSGAVDVSLSLASLSPDRREAFVLTQLLGLPYADAAAVCQVPLGTIRSRVARAREDLQAVLGRAAG